MSPPMTYGRNQHLGLFTQRCAAVLRQLQSISRNHFWIRCMSLFLGSLDSYIGIHTSRVNILLKCIEQRRDYWGRHLQLVFPKALDIFSCKYCAFLSPSRMMEGDVLIIGTLQTMYSSETFKNHCLHQSEQHKSRSDTCAWVPWPNPSQQLYFQNKKNEVPLFHMQFYFGFRKFPY